MKIGTTLAIIGLFAVAGCRDPENLVPVDLSHPQDMGGGSADDMTQPGGDMKAAATCTSYTPSTIAAMRGAGTSGCFQVGAMAPAVALAVTASSKTGTLVLQDSAGGDDSAVLAKCSTSAGTTYPCSALTAVGAITVGHSVTVSGYYAKTKGGLETLHIFDTVTDSGSAGTVPAAATVTFAEAGHASTLADKKKYYQKVSVTLGGATVKV